MTLASGCSAGMSNSSKPLELEVLANNTQSLDPKPDISSPKMTTGPIPGGASDCSAGLWLFVLDYSTWEGEYVQGANASGYCFEEIESRLMSNTLELQNSPANSGDAAALNFIDVITPLDADASNCEREYGFRCKD
jgi:hypothetical protein